jgi:hypothetical protein
MARVMGPAETTLDVDRIKMLDCDASSDRFWAVFLVVRRLHSEQQHRISFGA